MKQSDLGLDLSNRRTRKQVFLDEMERVVPWQAFLALIAPHAPVKATGRKPFPIETMLRIHFLQQWFLPQHVQQPLEAKRCVRRKSLPVRRP